MNVLPSPMKGYSISSLTPCSISTSNVLSSFTSLRTLMKIPPTSSSLIIFTSHIHRVIIKQGEHLLNIGALITDNLLSHLKPSWTQLSGSHFLSTVTFSFPWCLFGYWFISHNLRTKLETFVTAVNFNHIEEYPSYRLCLPLQSFRNTLLQG